MRRTGSSQAATWLIDFQTFCHYFSGSGEKATRASALRGTSHVLHRQVEDFLDRDLHAGRNVVVYLLVCAAFADAAEEPAKPPVDDLREIRSAAERYELFLGSDRRRLAFEREPVLTWPNPTRETPEGATFIWTLDGRPEAIGCIWKHGVLSLAFHSLSTNKLTAQDGSETVWDPQGAGISLASFDDAPPPAESATKRLGQMRGLARRFRCRLTDDSGKEEELRLLPTPLYRYKTDRQDLFDGAIFAFAQGTDPEVILLLEARRREGNSSHWQYAITRRSMLALEADLDGQRVWSVPVSIGGTHEPWLHGVVAPAR